MENSIVGTSVYFDCLNIDAKNVPVCGGAEYGKTEAFSGAKVSKWRKLCLTGEKETVRTDAEKRKNRTEGGFCRAEKVGTKIAGNICCAENCLRPRVRGGEDGARCGRLGIGRQGKAVSKRASRRRSL